METKQTAVEWLYGTLITFPKTMDDLSHNARSFEQAKQIEKEQIGYTEEQAYQFWKAGQKYWETSGKSITFEELIEQYHNKTYNK
jgi:hypothetical protein